MKWRQVYADFTGQMQLLIAGLLFFLPFIGFQV